MVPIEPLPGVRRNDPSGPPPRRVRLSRAKGWRLPPNTIVVSRPSKWGNPFVVGQDGNSESCVRWHAYLLNGYFVLGATPDVEEMRTIRKYAVRNIHRLRGKNLACWCALGKPCHADTLLEWANGPLDDGATTRHTQIPPQPIRPKEFPPPTRPEEPTIHTENQDGE